MNLSSSMVGFSSELFSANKVLRGTDVMVNNGNVFSGAVLNFMPAGGICTNQLINPVGSGIYVFVDAIDIMLTVAGSGGVSFTGVAAPTGVSNLVSQKDGVVFGLAQTRLDAAAPGAFVNVAPFGGGAFQVTTVRPPFPYQLSPGKGINVVNDNIAGAFFLVTTFHTREFTF